MKKFISIFILLTIICSSFVAFSVSAETVSEKKYGNEIRFFYDSNIYDFEFYDDDAITRMEYAIILVRLLNAENLLDSYNENVFSDVTSATPGHEYVDFLRNLGIIKGNSDSTFRPDDNLTLNEAVACLVRLLGYSTKADYTGGYTTGYMKSAMDIGLLRGVDTSMCSEYMAAGPLSKMLFNALDKNIMNSYYIKDSDVSVMGGNDSTILEILGYEKAYGKVNGIENINLYSIVEETLEDTQIEINGEVYKTYDSTLKELFGYDVEYYYKKSETDRYGTLVTTIKRYDSAKEMILYTDDIASVSSSTVTYYEENTDKEKTVKLSQGCIILDNGSPVSTMKTEYSPKNGFIRLISNNGSTYDVALIYDFETFIVKNKRNETLTFKYNVKPSWETKNSTDLSKIPYSVFEDGEYTDLDSVRNDSVVMIAYGKSGCYIYPSSQKISGKIEAINNAKENEYLISNNYYKINPDFQKLIDAKVEGTYSFNIGLDTTYYLDYMGNIYGITDVESDFQYGYLYALNSNGVFEKEVQAKVLCEQSGGIGIFDIAQNVYVDGSKISAEDAHTKMNAFMNDTSKSPVFKFKCNSEGKISEIVLNTIQENAPSKIGDDSVVLSAPKMQRIWHGQDDYYYFTGYLSDIGTIYAGSSALTFKINTNQTEEKYYTVGNAKTMLPSGTDQRTTVSCYDVDEYGVPSLIIYYDTAGGSNVKFTNAIHFVDSTYYGVNEKGDSVIGLNLLDKTGAKKSFLTNGENSVTNACTVLKKGDIIQISTNSSNVVEGVEKVFSYNYTASDISSSFTADTGYFAQRLKINGSEGNFALYTTVVGVGKYEASNILKFSKIVKPGSSNAAMDYFRMTKSFLIYDGNEVYSATSDDLETGDVVFAIGSAERIYQMVVFRNVTFYGDEFIYRSN